MFKMANIALHTCVYSLYIGSEDIFSELPCSNNPKVVSLAETSNVGMDGLWLFRIDQNTIEPACTNRGGLIHTHNMHSYGSVSTQ